MEEFLFQAEDLHAYMIRFFQRVGVSQGDAKITADVLITADLRGISSHGIIRLDSYYGMPLEQGYIDPRSPIHVITETPVTALLDGGNGLGPVIAYRAMERCIEKANQSNVAFIAVRNSNHYGIAGYYAMMALPQDMIGISVSNSQPSVAPTHGREAVLGTNPISVAVPAGKEFPYVLDMATSIVSIGRIVVHQKTGKEIPVGWAIDKSGQLTTDPAAVLNGGSLLPLGGDEIMRGYKGYGLMLLVDILSGVLSGAAFGSDVGSPNKNKRANVGHFFGAIKISAFRSKEEFTADMDRLIQRLKTTALMPGQDRIYIHGEKEFELAKQRRQEGIPLHISVIRGLEDAGRRLGVKFDLPCKSGSYNS
ncbi:Ldh family oxidoreductase [Candidatus Acetothermia bacterium]|nr:Ldh family oxidoreductase [Candidatus Acetothermia bacterium]